MKGHSEKGIVETTCLCERHKERRGPDLVYVVQRLTAQAQVVLPRQRHRRLLAPLERPPRRLVRRHPLEVAVRFLLILRAGQPPQRRTPAQLKLPY